MPISTTSWPDSAVREWNSLNLETNPELFGEACLGFAARQETAGRMNIAFSALAELSNLAGPPPELRRRARERLEVLQGRGPSPARIEYLLRHFTEAATDPATLLAMGAAGAVFRATRLGFLARHASSVAGPLTRGLLGRSVATSAAFALEAPTFTITARLGNAMLGREQDWSARALARELASSFLTLGGLKLGLSGAGFLQRTLSGRVSQGLSFHAFTQGGALFGLLLGHGLEQYFGLRERERNRNILIESLATLLQFHVAGRLVSSSFGRLGGWERALEGRSELLSVYGLPRNVSQTRFPRLMPHFSPATSFVDPILASVPSRAHSARPQVLYAENSRENQRLTSILGIPLLSTGFLKGEVSGEKPSLEDYPRIIEEWGDAFLEQNQAEISRFLPELKRYNENIETGGAINSREHRRLRGFLRKVTVRLEAFTEFRRTIRNAIPPADPLKEKTTAVRERLRLTLHDLQYRTEPLTMAGLALENLLSGNPIRPYQKAFLFSPGGGNSASGAAKNGIASACVENPELLQWVGPNWHQTNLDGLRFTEGRRPAKIVGDMIANLLTNAARYRSSENPVIRLWMEPGIGGGLRVTVHDDGIGILPEHLARLGETGFREGRREISRSQGLGLSSIIENLRGLAWGPLWVRSRPGEGSRFRFEIPGEAFANDSNSGVKEESGPREPESSLEVNLREGFLVPAASMDLAIHQLLRDIPGLHNTMGPAGNHRPLRIDSLARGESRNRRLEVLHRLLASGRDPAEVEAVENGPGVLVDIAVSVARMGTRVRIKEPDALAGALFMMLAESELPASLRDRLHMVSPREINAPSPADIVYWANPTPLFLDRLASIGSQEYLGRDVKAGGYLVIQTDHLPSERVHGGLPQLDPAHWRKIFDAPIPDLPGVGNAILPTAQGPNLHFLVFQRR